MSSHQTVRLCAGRERAALDGVSVLELASMLAGERFSDRPRCVCPVVRGFLRAYNDLIDDERRQDLYGYAAQAVGTAEGGRAARDARMRHCRAFVDRYGDGSVPGRWPALTPGGRAERLGLSAGRAAALNAAPLGHAIALTLLDVLIRCGVSDAARSASAVGAGW